MTDKGQMHMGIPSQNTETAGTDSNQGSHSGKTDDPLTRDQVLRLSSQTIRALHKRVNGTRFKEQAGDSAKLAYVRALSQVLQLYAALLRDSEIIDLEKRIAELERQKDKGP